MEVQTLHPSGVGPTSPILSSNPQIMPRASSLERSAFASLRSAEASRSRTIDEQEGSRRLLTQSEHPAPHTSPEQLKGKGKAAESPNTTNAAQPQFFGTNGHEVPSYADSPCSSLISTFEPMQIDTSSQENHVHFAPGRVSLLPSVHSGGQWAGSKLKNEVQLDEASDDAESESNQKAASIRSRPRSVSALAVSRSRSSNAAHQLMVPGANVADQADGFNDRSFLPDVGDERPASRTRGGGLLKMRGKADSLAGARQAPLSDAHAAAAKPVKESAPPPTSAALAIQYSSTTLAEHPRDAPARHRSSGTLRNLFRRRPREDEEATPVPAPKKLPGESEWEASLRASDEKAQKASEKARRAHALAAEFSLEKPVKRVPETKPRARSRHSISSAGSAVSAEDLGDGRVYRITREQGHNGHDKDHSALPSYRSRTSTAEHTSPLQRTPASALEDSWASRHYSERARVADASFFSPASSSSGSFRSRSDSSAGCGAIERRPSDTSALSSHHHYEFEAGARVRFEDSPTLGSDNPHEKRSTPSPRSKRPSTAGSPYRLAMSSSTKLARVLGGEAEWSAGAHQSIPSSRLQDPAIYTGSMVARHPYAVAAQQPSRRPNTSHASSTSQSSEDWKQVIDEAYVANETLLRRLPASSDDLRITSNGGVLSPASSTRVLDPQIESSQHHCGDTTDGVLFSGLSDRRHAPRPRKLELPPSPVPSSSQSDPSRSSTPRRLSASNMLGLRPPTQTCSTGNSSVSDAPTSRTLSMSGDSALSCDTSSRDAGESEASSGYANEDSSNGHSDSPTASRASSVFRSSAFAASPLASPTIRIKDLSEPNSASQSICGAVALSPRRMSRTLSDSGHGHERCLSPRRIPIATPPPTAPLPLPPMDSPRSFVTTLSRASSVTSHSQTLSPTPEACILNEDSLKTPTM